jgi:hypothetical protein
MGGDGDKETSADIARAVTTRKTHTKMNGV